MENPYYKKMIYACANNGAEGEANTCEFVRSPLTKCEGSSMFDFEGMYHCTFKTTFGDTGGLITFLLFAVSIDYIDSFKFFAFGIAIYLLASTADEYLAPALEAISNKLECSQSLAGVTLLALGNGAPDVFAALSAGGYQEEQVNLQIASLYGSVFYIAALVMWLTLKASANGDTIHVTRNFFIRDTVFIMLTSVYTLVIMLVFEGFTLMNSAGFLVIYVLFVIVVIIQARMNQMDIKEAEEG
jgi:Ca2+/Na+ antiporter